MPRVSRAKAQRAVARAAKQRRADDGVDDDDDGVDDEEDDDEDDDEEDDAEEDKEEDDDGDDSDDEEEDDDGEGWVLRAAEAKQPASVNDALKCTSETLASCSLRAPYMGDSRATFFRRKENVRKLEESAKKCHNIETLALARTN